MWCVDLPVFKNFVLNYVQIANVSYPQCRVVVENEVVNKFMACSSDLCGYLFFELPVLVH
jgi:hypothetical protein